MYWHTQIIFAIALCAITTISSQVILPSTIVLKNVGLDKYVCQSADKYGPSWFNKVTLMANTSAVDECNWNTDYDIKSKTFTLRNRKSNQYLLVGSEFYRNEPLQKILTAETKDVTHPDAIKWHAEALDDGKYKFRNDFSGAYIYSFVDGEDSNKLMTWESFGCAGDACEWLVSE